MVLESTYGWYWAVDALQAAGASVHLAHPLGVKAFAYRRVKNDERDAADLADLLRMGRLPEAWIAPPATRELRELVRHRAKLVGLRSHCKAEVHAVLAKCGVAGADERPVRRRRHAAAGRAGAAQAVRGPDRLAAPGDGPLDFEIDVFAKLAAAGWPRDPGYPAVQTIPGIGPVLAAVFVAEIGDITRFPTADQLTCWAGLTPKHHESDTNVHRGRITKQGSRLVRWAAVESVQRLPKHQPSRARSATRSAPAAATTSAWSPPPAGNWSTSTTRCATTTSAGSHPAASRTCSSCGLVNTTPELVGAGRAGHDPRHPAWSRPSD